MDGWVDRLEAAPQLAHLHFLAGQAQVGADTLQKPDGCIWGRVGMPRVTAGSLIATPQGPRGSVGFPDQGKRRQERAGAAGPEHEVAMSRDRSSSSPSLCGEDLGNMNKIKIEGG